MRAALIPPRGYYHTALKSNYMLALAQLATPAYEQTYLFDIPNDAHLILDNGAAEGQLVDPKVLWYQARRYGPEELVVPDVLGDKDETLRKAEAFIDGWSEQKRIEGMRPMLVVQGKSMDEAKQCIDRFFGLFGFDITIALPRHFLKTFSYGRARIDLTSFIREDFDNDAQIHLLGTSHLWPEEVKCAAQETKARGIDTSLPYNYTIEGLHLDEWEHNRRVMRRKDYFINNWQLDEGLMQHNIDVYLSWASGA